MIPFLLAWLPAFLLVVCFAVAAMAQTRTWLLKAVCAYLALLLMIPAAWAADTIVDFRPIWDGIVPTIIAGLSTILVAFFGWAAYQFQRMTGIKVEEKDMMALHSAAMTGAKLVLARIGSIPMTLDVHNPSLKVGVEWMMDSVPDAIRRLGVSQEKMVELIKSKLTDLQIQSTATPVVVTNTEVPATMSKS